MGQLQQTCGIKVAELPNRQREQALVWYRAFGKQDGGICEGKADRMTTLIRNKEKIAVAARGIADAALTGYVYGPVPVPATGSKKTAQ